MTIWNIPQKTQESWLSGLPELREAVYRGIPFLWDCHSRTLIPPYQKPVKKEGGQGYVCLVDEGAETRGNVIFHRHSARRRVWEEGGPVLLSQPVA